MDIDSGSLPRKLVECRICHDEDADLNMEVPSSCRGSLKLKPDYVAPPPPFHYGVVPVNLRRHWEISRRELHPQFTGMFSTRHDISHAEFDDDSSPTSKNLICCRVVAVIFMVLLVLRHTLPIIFSGAGDYSLTSLMLLTLITIGILLPIYIMVGAFAGIKRRRQQQDSGNFSLTMSDEESEPQQQQPLSNLISV